MAQDAFGLALVVVDARVTPGGHLGGHAEVSRQAFEVALFYFDPRVAAAVSGALRAVVLNLRGGGAHAFNQAKGDERLGRRGRLKLAV